MTSALKRRTKILATLGPASDGALKMEELLRAGVDLFRVNFSHGDHAQHAARIAAAREAERASGHPVALLADLQGPKLRVGDLPGGAIDVRMSSELRLRAAAKSDDPEIIAIPHRQGRRRRPHRAADRARPHRQPQGHHRAQPPDPDSSADGKRHR
jgi:pyruvate kinase